MKKYIFVSGLILILFAGVAQAGDNLIAHWDFDDVLAGWEARDVSGNGIHGYIGRALSGVAGFENSGLLFDGDGDYVNMGDEAALDFGPEDSFTLSAWVKLDDSIGDYRAIIGKASGSSLDGYILRHCQDGNLGMAIESSDNAVEASAVAKQDYRDNQWHQAVGVINRDGQTNTLYVDGIQKAQVDIGLADNFSNDYNFNLGSLNNGSVSFKGVLDEVRVYNYALSSAEIRQLYSSDSGQTVVLKTYPAGSLLQAINSVDVYYLNQKGQRKLIINEKVFELYGNKWEDIVEVTEEELKQYPVVKLIRAYGDEKVYAINGETKQWIETLAEFNSLGYQWSDVNLVKIEELAEYE